MHFTKLTYGLVESH